DSSPFSAWLIIIIALAIFFLVVFAPTSSDRAVPSSPGSLSSPISGIWTNYLYPFFLLFDLVFLVGVVLVAVFHAKHKQAMKLKEREVVIQKAVKHKRDRQIIKLWLQVAGRAKAGGQENLRLAILEGDSLVDLFLKKYGYEGETMADRLSQIIEEDVKSMERLWKAHRLRNDIAHNPSFKVGRKEAQDALTAYRDFLIEVGVL
ncbi:MAG: hypothetical protein Q8P45_00555, partial [Candidatus Harrisonbacteria bacterium]|nr:hypothetical protein [Candidatus Harrisonbacteria bacterium]